MNKLKIKLSTLEMVSDFIKVCSKYDCDINVYDGSIIVDAKSIIGVFSIVQGKEIEVQGITNDKNVVSGFINDMKNFEV